MKHAPLIQMARKVRIDILTMAYRAQSAHTGGALSCVELLVALYFDVMKIYPKNHLHPDRDRFVFSKAHDAKALYVVLAHRGFFDKKILESYEIDNGVLSEHSTRHCVPGVEASAGSLGHGLSMAAGMAYAGKIDKKKYRIFAMLSDGDCDEGSTWEAALFAGHHRLDNLTVIIDCNSLQGYGYTKDILNLEPFPDKWKAFGWSVQSVDGHSLNELIKVISSVPFAEGRPSVVIASTTKGYGGPQRHVNQISSQYNPPTEEEYEELVVVNEVKIKVDRLLRAPGGKRR